LLDFFFLDAEEVAELLELAGAEEELACCGLDAVAEAALAARAGAADTLMASVRNSDAAIGSLVIFSPLQFPAGRGVFRATMRPGQARALIMMIFRAVSSWVARRGAYRATGTE
jgi:hypothetical protein